MNVEQISTGAIVSAMLLSPGALSADIQSALQHSMPQETANYTSPKSITVTASQARAALMRQAYAAQSSASYDLLSISDVSDAAEIEDAATLVANLRTLTGLTWAQIAHVFGVSNRAPYHWAAGKNISAENHKRLGEVFALVSFADRGSAEENRDFLLGAARNGRTFLDLLGEGRDDEFRELAGQGTGRPMLPNRATNDAEEFNLQDHWGSLAAASGSEIVEVTVVETNTRRAKPKRAKS